MSQQYPFSLGKHDRISGKFHYENPYHWQRDADKHSLWNSGWNTADMKIRNDYKNVSLLHPAS